MRIEVEPGVELFVQDLGEGRPVVLIAGFGMDHAVWDAEVRMLTERHRVVCIDLRGHGLSDKPLDGYDIDRLVADVLAVLEALDLRAVTLVGWSLGGQVAFGVAAAAPDRLAQLVLVATNGVRASRSREFPFGPPAQALEQTMVQDEKRSRIAARRKAIASGFHRKPDADTLGWLVRRSLQMPSWAAVACYGTLLNADLVEAIPRVKLPVLQIVGAADPVHSLHGARWLVEQLSDIRLVELPDCGHYPMLEAPEALHTALLSFVGGFSP